MGKNIHMEERDWIELLSGKNQVQKVMEMNQKTEKFGLALTQADAEMLVEVRREELKKQQRVEFGEGILPKLIFTFCDSAYINQENYVETLIQLQEIFYLYKNEMSDEVSDDELLQFMKEQFEGICFGDLEYLSGTCLHVFGQAVRAGYRGYEKTQGQGEYEQFDVVRRWDHELYMEALRELCWR